MLVYCTFFLSHVPNFLASAGRNGSYRAINFFLIFCGLHPVTPNSDKNLIFRHDSLHKGSISRIDPSTSFSTFTVKPLLSSPLLSRHSLLRGHLSIFRNLLPVFSVKMDFYSTATSIKRRRSPFGFLKWLILL